MGKYGREAPISEMEAQRAMLDSLMGLNRNMDNDEAEIADHKDDRLCRCFMYGVCPKEGFVNTKMASGTCHLLHSEEYKESLEANEQDRYLFDDEVEREYNKYLMEAERQIKRARSRVEDDGSKMPSETSTNADDHPEVIKLRASIDMLTAEAEKAGSDGDIDQAQILATQVEELQQKKLELVNKVEEENRQHGSGDSVNKKLRVCDVCGSLLSILDSDKRLADHFMGKQHMTFQIMRDVVEEIRERRKNRPADWRAPAPVRGNNNNGRTDRDKERDRDTSGRRDDRREDRDRRVSDRRDRDRPARDREPRDREPRDREPRDREPRDREPRDREPREEAREQPSVLVKIKCTPHYDELDRVFSQHEAAIVSLAEKAGTADMDAVSVTEKTSGYDDVISDYNLCRLRQEQQQASPEMSKMLSPESIKNTEGRSNKHKSTSQPASRGEDAAGYESSGSSSGDDSIHSGRSTSPHGEKKKHVSSRDTSEGVKANKGDKEGERRHRGGSSGRGREEEDKHHRHSHKHHSHRSDRSDKSREDKKRVDEDSDRHKDGGKESRHDDRHRKHRDRHASDGTSRSKRVKKE